MIATEYQISDELVVRIKLSSGFPIGENRSWYITCGLSNDTGHGIRADYWRRGKWVTDKPQRFKTAEEAESAYLRATAKQRKAKAEA